MLACGEPAGGASGKSEEPLATDPCGEGLLLDDTEACVPEACGASRWGDTVVDPETVFVDANAEPNGDGSEDAPFQSIQLGADRAAERSEGATVAIAAGTYAELLLLGASHNRVELVGRCHELVTLDGTPGSLSESTLTIRGNAYTAPVVTLQGMTIAEGPGGGMWLQDTEVSARDLAVVANTWVGILITGERATVTLEHSSVTDTVDNQRWGIAWGIVVQSGASLTADQVTVERNAGIGVSAVSANTHVSLSECTIADTLPLVDGNASFGVFADAGASLTATACQIVRNTGGGVRGRAPETRVRLVDTVVADNLPSPDDSAGWGVSSTFGAEITVEKSAVERNHGAGIFAESVGSTIALYDTVIADTHPGDGGLSGHGLRATFGAAVTAQSCLISGNHSTGVYAYGTDTTIQLSDTTVEETQMSTTGAMGRGIAATAGASVTAESCLLSNNHASAVHAAGEETRGHLVDSTLTDTWPSDADDDGRGINVQTGATLVAESCLVQRSHQVGVQVSGPGTVATLVGTTVTETQPQADGKKGRGVSAQDGATVTVTSSIIADNYEIGAFALGEGTTVSLVDTTVSETKMETSGTLGRGLVAQAGGVLLVDNSVVERAHGLGVWASGEGSLISLVDSTVTQTQAVGDTVFARGVVAQRGARVEGLRLTSSENEGPGIYAVYDGAVTCSTCLLDDNAFASAVVVEGGTMTLLDSTIAATRSDVNLGGGIGVYAARGISADAPATVRLEGSTVEAQVYSGLWLEGPGTYELVDNTLQGGPGFAPWEGAWWHGDAVYVAGGVAAWVQADATGLLVRGNTVRDGRHGLFLDGATATLDDNTWSGNETDVWQQRCDETTPLDADATASLPSSQICPDHTRLTATLAFENLYFDDSALAD